MNHCRLERDVMLAAIDDRWTDALRRHVTDCADCAAAAAVSPWMQSFSRVDEREHLLPDPAVVWIKAQLLRGSAAIERVSRPLAIYQLIAYSVVAAGWAAMLTWKWDALTAWLASLTPSGLVTTAAGSTADAALPFFLLVVVLSSLTVVLAFHTILAEE
ncbi:MAG TPA: hypothetical protein VF698_03220 [Thermoanaerobaculia bacterium]|jgi:hypothetical protein